MLTQTVLAEHVNGMKVELASGDSGMLKSPTTKNLLLSSIIWSSMSAS